jgi:hypothetical protein
LEGCIRETLSALDLVNQVDKQQQQAMTSSYLNKQLTLDNFLTETTKQITMEEAQHAALAWRTIRWICETDAKVYAAVQNQVLNDKTMESMLRYRFPAASTNFRTAWQSLYQKLIPYVVTGKSIKGVEYCFLAKDDDDDDGNNGDSKKTLLLTVSERIVDSLACQVVSAKEEM